MSKSVVPRGFSRFYVLSLLKEKPMTGKEIMDETTRRSEGAWKPSPGLVYPLLGKLLSEGLVEEVDGRYRTTAAGSARLDSYEGAHDEFDRRLGGLIRIGLYGKFVAQDVVDKVISMTEMLREDITSLTEDQKVKYRTFLRSELQRLDEAEKRRQGPDMAAPTSSS
jgi:DNA-binding PadR family transcriptional regulator